MNTVDVILIIVSGIATIATTILTVKKSNNMTNYRLDKIEKNLEKNQTEFSSFVTRLYRAEENLKIHDEQLKNTNHRIDDLEKKVYNQ